MKECIRLIVMFVSGFACGYAVKGTVDIIRPMPIKPIAETQTKEITLEDIIDAIDIVEGSGIGDLGKAIGEYQIHKIYVDDVNRIIGYKYTYADRWCPVKSREMVTIYLDYYSKYIKADSEEKLIEGTARMHNEGPDAWRDDPHWFVRNRELTLEEAEKKIAKAIRFWEKVKKVLYGQKM